MILSTQVEEFREVFHEFDIDGDGTISIKVHLEVPPYTPPYLIFVIFFRQSNFLENKIYTEKRQFFTFNL